MSNMRAMAVRLSRAAGYSAALAAVGLLLLAQARCGAKEPEPVRAIYLGADECTQELISTLHDIGFDTLFVTNNSYDMDLIRPGVALAKEHGMRFYWTMWFHGGPEIGRGFEGNPRRFVRQDGTITQRTTCPLDEVYWQRAVGERALMLARWAAQEPAVTGISFDIEMYAGASDYDWDQFCVCDKCWDAYRGTRQSVPASSELKPADRWPWLERKRQTADYASFEHQQVRRITAEIARQAREIAPGFRFAILPYGTIFADDVLAGFGTEQAPCLAMSEETYSAGYRMDVEADAFRLEREGIHALMLLGCWAFKRPPMEWAAHAYLGGTRLGGYWVYEQFPKRTIFLESDPAEREKHKLRGGPQEWQDAFRLANSEITKALANPAYRPTLPVLRLHRADYAMDLAGLPLAGPALAKPKLVSWQERGMHWAGQFVELPTHAPGDQVTFVLPHRYGGPHEVKVWLAGGPYHGIVKVLLDGKEIGQPVDTYAPAPTPTLFLVQGKAALDAQQHVLALRVIGKNEASAGFAIAAESAYLEYDGPFCRDFLVVGPFDNADHRGFYEAYAPEREANPSASYIGTGGQRVTWQRVQTDESGFVDLEKLLKPKEWVVAYAVTHLYSERPRVARLLLGSDDGARVWLNGEPVWAAIEVRGADADKDRFEVMLRKGWNRLLIKVEQGQGGWGVRIRATDPGPKANPRWEAHPGP
jgi:hypothetical protein